MARAIRANLPGGGTFWDVGANVGLMSLFAANIGGSVLSFEPSPEVLKQLRHNAEALKNIKVMPYGIGSQNGEAKFAAQGTSTASSFVEAVTAINQNYFPGTPIEQVPVAMRKLDTVLLAQHSPPPSLVKIDIEGFELEALKGAQELLATVRPKLLIEIHPYQLTLSGGTENELFEILQRHGYSWSVIDRNPNSLYTIMALVAEPDGTL